MERTFVLDTQKLLVFAAVAREGGFSRAARVLGQTQSAVSQSVAKLEEVLGRPLFVRARRAIALTDAGARLLPHADRILESLAEAKRDLEESGDELRGGLVVATTDTLACFVLPPVFARFRERHPKVEVKLVFRPSPKVASLVASGEAHLGVANLPLPKGSEAPDKDVPRRLETIPLMRHADVAICPPDHPLSGRSRTTLEALRGHPWLLPDRGTATRAFLEEEMKSWRERPLVRMEMASVEVLKRLVELGFGISFVPELSVTREVADGRLSKLQLVGVERDRHVGLLIPAAKPRRPAAEAFSSAAREVLRERKP